MPTYVPILDAEVSAEQPVTVSLVTRLRDNALTYMGAPSGTRTVFNQTAAPLGWTKDGAAGLNDAGLRTVTGSVGSGGVVDYSVLHARTATDGFTIAKANLTSFNFTSSSQFVTSASINPAFTGVVIGGTNVLGTGTTVANNTSAVTVPSGGTSTPKTAPIDMRVRYNDVIVAAKD